MEPGERDRRVTIQRKAASTATTGFPVETWTTLANVWMSQAPVRGMEQFAANQLSAKVDMRWEMPYRPDMDPDIVDVPNERRLLFRGRAYDIVSASMIGLKAGVELTTVAATTV